MKKNNILIILFALIIILAGCTNQEQSHTESKSPPVVNQATNVSSDNDTAYDSTVEESEKIATEKETTTSSSAELPQQAEKKTESDPIDSKELKPDGTARPSKQAETIKTDDSEKKTESSADAQLSYVRPSTVEVEKLVAKYINDYRIAQGSSVAKVLPGLTEVARYRAKQLITDFSHESDPDACTVLKYGEFVDMTELGYSEDYNYYRGYNREAVAKGSWTGTADDIAKKIAVGFKNSSGHWTYVGSSEYAYMAVGITYNEVDDRWYCCVCMSSKNYGG
mgnify:FL=1